MNVREFVESGSTNENFIIESTEVVYNWLDDKPETFEIQLINHKDIFVAQFKTYRCRVDSKIMLARSHLHK